MPTEARWLCLALAAAVTFQLFYLGAQPFAAGLIPAPWDKLAHLAVYAILTMLLWIGTAGRMPLAVIATAIAIGVTRDATTGLAAQLHPTPSQESLAARKSAP